MDTESSKTNFDEVQKFSDMFLSNIFNKDAKREEHSNNYKHYDLLIQDLQDRLGHEEDAHSALSSQKKKLEQELSQQKKEIEDLELSLQKV